MKRKPRRRRRAAALLSSVAAAVALSLMPAAAAHAGWVKYDVDSASAYSSDGKAKLAGT